MVMAVVTTVVVGAVGAAVTATVKVAAAVVIPNDTEFALNMDSGIVNIGTAIGAGGGGGGSTFSTTGGV